MFGKRHIIFSRITAALTGAALLVTFASCSAELVEETAPETTLLPISSVATVSDDAVYSHVLGEHYSNDAVSFTLPAGWSVDERSETGRIFILSDTDGYDTVYFNCIDAPEASPDNMFEGFLALYSSDINEYGNDSVTEMVCRSANGNSFYWYTVNDSLTGEIVTNVRTIHRVDARTYLTVRAVGRGFDDYLATIIDSLGFEYDWSSDDNDALRADDELCGDWIAVNMTDTDGNVYNSVLTAPGFLSMGITFNPDGTLEWIDNESNGTLGYWGIRDGSRWIDFHLGAEYTLRFSDDRLLCDDSTTSKTTICEKMDSDGNVASEQTEPESESSTED